MTADQGPFAIRDDQFAVVAVDSTQVTERPAMYECQLAASAAQLLARCRVHTTLAHGAQKYSHTQTLFCRLSKDRRDADGNLALFS